MPAGQRPRRKKTVAPKKKTAASAAPPAADVEPEPAPWVTYRVVGLEGASPDEDWWIAMAAYPEVLIGEPKSMRVVGRLGLGGTGTFVAAKVKVCLVEQLGEHVFHLYPMGGGDAVSAARTATDIVAVPPDELRGTGWPGAPSGRARVNEGGSVVSAVSMSRDELAHLKAKTKSAPGGFSGEARRLLLEKYPLNK